MKSIKLHKNILKLSFIFSLLVLAFLSLELFTTHLNSNNTDIANAQGTPSCTIDGWAWSGYGSPPVEGIGWVSFSSSNPDADGGDYDVEIDSSGVMTGFAWSSNIGWIKFGGFSGFPEIPGSGTTAVNARAVPGEWPPVSAGTSNFEGWARACAVYVSGCSDALRGDPELGGWDGWISLRGTNYGVSYNSDPVSAQFEEFEGFAWGGPYNVGWLSFNSNNGSIDYAVKISNASACLDPDSDPFDYTMTVTDQIVPNPDVDVNGRFSAPTFASIDFISNPDITPVEITSVSLIGSLDPDILIEDITIDQSDCTSDCQRNITIDFQLLNGFESDFVANFEVTANTVPGEIANERTDTLTIQVLFGSVGEGNACTATPGVAFISQDVTWTAQAPEDVNNYYFWHKPNTPGTPNPSGDIPVIDEGAGLSSFQESFDQPGVYFRYARICADGTAAACDQVTSENVCSAVIILNPEFDPF